MIEFYESAESGWKYELAESFLFDRGSDHSVVDLSHLHSVIHLPPHIPDQGCDALRRAQPATVSVQRVTAKRVETSQCMGKSKLRKLK